MIFLHLHTYTRTLLAQRLEIIFRKWGGGGGGGEEVKLQSLMFILIFFLIVHFLQNGVLRIDLPLNVISQSCSLSLSHT